MTIVVTGAGGFLGQAIVAAARQQGYPVRAVVRKTVPETWAQDPQIEVRRCDLAQQADLGSVQAGDVVIHAAASFGDDATQKRDTGQGTENLLAALPQGARLVLVSSFSVYDYVHIGNGDVLREASALEPNLQDRDAYTRAKIAQELVAQEAMATRGIDLRIARPAVIYAAGPRAWTPLLGWNRGGRVITTALEGQIPAVHVEDCAAQILQLATLDSVPKGTIVNLVSSGSPTRGDWIRALGLRPIVLPQALFFWFSHAFRPLLPTGLRPARLSARFKPLRYDTSHTDAVLGPLPPRDALAHMKDSA